MTAAGLAVRGTSNGNSNGNSRDRARRRAWLITTFRADCDVLGESALNTDTPIPVAPGEGVPACRCYRCGVLLVDVTAASALLPISWHVTVDRIIPGCKGGTYRRDNIRPACGDCNSETGGRLSRGNRRRKLVSV